MGERELQTPRLDSFAYRHTWTYVAVPSVVTGLLMLAACAARDWHAPRAPTIVVLLAGALLMGAVAGRAYFSIRCERDRQRHGEEAVSRTRSASLGALAVSTAIAAVIVCASAAGVYELLGSVERVLASVIAALFTAAVPVVTAALQQAFSRRVIVGLDAVAIGSRVVRFRDLARVQADGPALALVLASGESIAARFASAHLAASLAVRIAARIEEGYRAPPALQRAGRALSEWRSGLTSPGYRDDHVSVEEAERVLDAAGASADERVGAALVLAHAKRGDRVRVAAAACVDRRLRVALEHAADDTLDDEALEAVTRSP